MGCGGSNGGPGRKGGREKKRGSGSMAVQRSQFLGSLDCHHQGLCTLPPAPPRPPHTDAHQTHKTPRTPLVWLYRDEGNRGPEYFTSTGAETRQKQRCMHTVGCTNTYSDSRPSPHPPGPQPCLPGWPGAHSRWPAGSSPGRPPGRGQPGAPARCVAHCPPAAPAPPGPRSAAHPRCAELWPPPQR